MKIPQKKPFQGTAVLLEALVCVRFSERWDERKKEREMEMEME